MATLGSWLRALDSFHGLDFVARIVPSNEDEAADLELLGALVARLFDGADFNAKTLRRLRTAVCSQLSISTAAADSMPILDVAAAFPIPAVLDGRCVRIEGQEPVLLGDTQAEVLKALILLGGVATKGELEKACKKHCDDPVKVLKTLLKANRLRLAPLITLPGGKGKGGYRTSITLPPNATK